MSDRGAARAGTEHVGQYVECRQPDGTYTFEPVGSAEPYVRDGYVVVSDSPDTPVRHDVPEWDDYFLGVAHAVAARGKCRRRIVGAVIVGDDKRILAAGYNGAPSGMPDCLEGGCPRGLRTTEEVKTDVGYDVVGSPGQCRALHAEANALAHSDGQRIRGATIYVNERPCPSCTKALAGAGIVRAVWPGGEFSPFDELWR